MNQQQQLRHRIDELEERLMDERRELARLQAQLAHEDVREFRLATLTGTVTLQEAFGDRQDLIVVHNMGAACAFCTLWADGFNGMLPHLESRAAFVVVSPDTPARQQEFARSRGWKFAMLSDGDGEFTRAMGFIRRHEREDQYWPGVSAFWRSPQGAVRRVGSSTFGPGDLFCPAWHLFGLLKDAAQSWEPQLAYAGNSGQKLGEQRVSCEHSNLLLEHGA